MHRCRAYRKCPVTFVTRGIQMMLDRSKCFRRTTSLARAPITCALLLVLAACEPAAIIELPSKGDSGVAPFDAGGPTLVDSDAGIKLEDAGPMNAPDAANTVDAGDTVDAGNGSDAGIDGGLERDGGNPVWVALPG